MNTRPTRRKLLVSGLAAIGTGVTGCVEQSNETERATTTVSDPTTTQRASTESPSPTATTADRAELPKAVGAELVAEGFTTPIGVEFLPDGTALIADQAGHISVLDGGDVRDRPLLDIRDRMVSLSGYEERGVLGIAVHPAFPDDPRLFVRYSAPSRSGTPDSFSHTFVLSSFTVDPSTLDAGGERTILELPQPQPNHNAGAIAFGPEGLLYVGVGDGGGANDTGTGHASDWYDRNGGGNGQDVTDNLLGSVLRIDVTDTGDRPYAIPDDNPLVGRDGQDEHYAWGFRNPWGMSFYDGELYVADVGQNRFEEVDHVRKGGNYGWNVREGRHCFSTASPSTPPEECPTETPDGEEFVDPVIEYPHSGHPVSGNAVIGGYFYAGTELPGLRDRYVFADWQAEGTLFVGTPTGEDNWTTDVLPIEGSMGSFVLGFGRDPAGEVYVCTTERGQVTGSTGAVYRLMQP